MAKKTYIKFSNGSTTLLIDMYDEARQREVIEDGFLTVMDGELPASVESSELIAQGDPSRAEMLRAIAERHANANAKGKANQSLSGRYKK